MTLKEFLASPYFIITMVLFVAFLILLGSIIENIIEWIKRSLR